jgi:molybdate transport system substrate-binding protein
VSFKIFSAGAARGIVTAALSVDNAKAESTFGAVGAVVDKLLAGAEADVVLLTAQAISQLAGKGIVDASSAARLGIVRAGFAVRKGDPMPSFATGAEMSDALLAADEIYVPDPERATSGIHFGKVLEQMGIKDKIWPKLRISPLGGEAIRKMLDSKAKRVLGFTQASEILEIEDAVFAGMLPKEFELATAYEVAVTTGAADKSAARSFVDTLSGQKTSAMREKAGFASA